MNASTTYRQAIGRRASLARWAPDASHAELDAAIWVMKAERALSRLNDGAPTITAAQRDRLQALLARELAGHCEDTSPRRLNLTAALGPTGYGEEGTP
ncbi:hypothetical protein [Streptomyces sp. NPDC003710]